MSLFLILTGCGSSSTDSASIGATATVADQPTLYAIDTLVRSLVLEDVDLHLRYAERDGDQLKLVLALYNNGSQDLLVVQGVDLERATLAGSNATAQIAHSATFVQGIVPEGGWYAGGASNGTLTFAHASGSSFTFALPGFPPIAFRLDAPLRAVPEPQAPDGGTYLLGFEGSSAEVPGVRIVLQHVEVTEEQLQLAITEVLDPSVARTSGVSFDGAAIFDRRWNQYRPIGVEGGDAGTRASADGQTETTPFVLHFARPRAGDVILLRIPGFPLIRVPLRADDQPAWAEARDLPPSSRPRYTFATPEQPLVRTDDPSIAFERLLHTLNLAFQKNDLERYLDAFVPSARSEQAALFAQLQTLPLEDVAFAADGGVQPNDVTDAADLEPIVRSVVWNYRIREDNAQNLFSSEVELVLERDGDTWRIGDIRGTVPFWASGPTAVQRSGAFWIFFRPEDREALATIEQDVGAALTRVSTVLPTYADGPFVVFVATTAEEFAEQTSRDPKRFAGAALSRWSFQSDAITIASAAFYINGAAFRAESSLDRRQTITHELTHLVLAQQTMPYTPLWLVEGMAMHVSEELPAAAMQEMWSGGTVEAWHLGEFTALRRFGEHDPQGYQTAMEYAYSAYLVRYLIATYGLERVLEFYASFAEIDGASIHDDMAEVSAPDSAEPVMSRLTLRLAPQLLQSSFDVDIPTLEQAFKVWLANEEFGELTTDDGQPTTGE